jgi:hypothetical protein
VNRRIACLVGCLVCLAMIWGCQDKKPGVRIEETHTPPEAVANPTHFFDFHINNIENPLTEDYKRRGSAQTLEKWGKEGKLSAEQKKKAIDSLEKATPTVEDADLKANFTTVLNSLKSAG